MSEEVKKQGFGYTDDADEGLRSKSGAKFGLNQSVNLTKFEYNPNAGKDGVEADALDITVQIGDRENNMRLYAVSRIFDGKGGEITDVNSEEYIKKYNEAQTQLSATVTHILKAFRSEEDIKNAMSAGFTSFADWAKVCQGLMPEGFEKQPVDVFMEWQWNISDGQDRTYLQLPKNMKGGYWICKAQEGNFTENRDPGLKYVNEGGAEHAFTRSANYMESPKANQQTEGNDDSAIAGSGDGKATASTW